MPGDAGRIVASIVGGIGVGRQKMHYGSYLRLLAKRPFGDSLQAQGSGFWIFLQMSQHPETESFFVVHRLDFAINGGNVAGSAALAAEL
jgi:hypothetical protein